MNQETPIFPLGTTYLPGDKVQLHIFEDRYVHMCSDIEKSNGQFVSVLIERGHEVGGSDTRSSKCSDMPSSKCVAAVLGQGFLRFKA